MKNEWVEKGVNIYDRIVKRWLNETRFTQRKAKTKTKTNT